MFVFRNFPNVRIYGIRILPVARVEYSAIGALVISSGGFQKEFFGAIVKLGCVEPKAIACTGGNGGALRSGSEQR